MPSVVVTGPAPVRHPLEHVKADERLEAIRHAHVWKPTQVSKMNLRTGPTGRGAFAPFATVSCDYVKKKLGGSTPKFACALTPKDEVKVKYGADNVEVYGEVAASRLLWALGFGADRWYPVTVVCRGCPADPHQDSHPTDNTVTFDTAAIVRPMTGQTIETRSDEGWSWPELDRVDGTAGGAPTAHRDALKLLAAMIQHTDSKPEQQRLICLPGASHVESGRCASPFLFIHDVGKTFGGAHLSNTALVSGVNLAEWSKRPVWEDPSRCVSKLSRSLTGTLDDPRISEAGRKFLSDLLARLSDRQLRDLFEVARFPAYSHAPVEDWIAVFKRKRHEIASVTCP